MIGLVRAIYALLLLSFPSASRDRVGKALMGTLIEDVRATSGLGAVARFFANAADLVQSGLAARRGKDRTSARTSLGLGRVWFDARLAVRSLAKTPGFALAAILSIALGIGLNTTIFSVVNALLLKPAPGGNPSELVTFFTSSDNDAMSSSSYPDYADLARSNSTMSGVMAHTLMFAGVDGTDSTRITIGELVSENYFDVLGIHLATGGGFPKGADRVGSPLTAVISYRMWQRDFAGQPGVIGRQLNIHGHKYAITGVAPESFGGFTAGVSAELWLPVGAVDDVEPVGIVDTVPSPTGNNRNERRGQRYLFLTGRLKPGMSLAQVRSDATSVMSALVSEYPATNKNRILTVVPADSVRVHPGVDGALVPSAGVLMAAVGLVLLVACSNIASLLLARATARTREMAIRLAVGAGRWQIIRQLVVESLVLSTLGGIAGLAGAIWLTRLIGKIRPPMQLSIAFDFAPDLRVFVFTFALAMVTGLIFGLAPALRASRPDLVPALKGVSSAAGPSRFSMRNFLVAGQMALSTVLLVVAALLLRSFLAASHADVRFDAVHVVYAAINSPKQFANDRDAMSFFDRAERQLASLPGVTSVARTDRLPFALTNNTTVIQVAGLRGPLKDSGWSIDTASVSSKYFETLGIPMMSGRAIDDRDRGTDSLPVAVVNETAARRFWPLGNAVGQTFHVRDDRDYTVIGVSRDHPVRAIGETPRPLVHFAIDQARPGFVNIVVRSTASPAATTSAVRRELVSIDPTLAFMGLEPLTGMIDTTLFPARAATVLLGAFGGLGLVLAALGLYGVISFTVASRARDIGIRMALGAARSNVVGSVLAQSFRLVAVGAVTGLLLAVAATQVLSGFLVGVSAFDPLSYIAAIGTLSVFAALASVIPARKAATVDPVQALRRG